MLRLAGELLPLGLGVALNPVAVATVLLIIGGPDQRRNGSAFILGWVLGLTLLLVPVGLALATGWHRGQSAHGELLRRTWHSLMVDSPRYPPRLTRMSATASRVKRKRYMATRWLLVSSTQV